MADENVLKVGAEFDVAPIVEGAKKATGALNAIGTETKGSFANIEAADQHVAQSVQKSTKEVVGGFVEAKNNGIFAYDALRAKLIEATAEVGRLRAEILETNDAATLAKLKEELAGATKEMQAARFQMRALGLETRETAEKMNLFGEALGTKIPSGLSNLLARLPSVQGAMAAAFEAGVILFFIHMLGEAANKVSELAEALAGFGEEAQKAYRAELEQNSRAILRNIEAEEKLRQVRLVGTEGAEKYRLEGENNIEAAKKYGEEQRRLTEAIEKTREEVEKLEKIQAFSPIAFGGMPENKKRLDDATASLAAMRHELETITGKVYELNFKSKTAPAEEAQRVRDEAIKTAEARAEATKERDDAFNAYELAEYHRRYSLGEISLEQERKLIEDGEKRKLAIEEKAFEERKRLEEAKTRTAAGGPSGVNVEPQILAMQAKMDKERIASSQRTAAETSAIDKEILARDLANAEAEIEAIHKVAEARLKLNQERAQRAFSQAEKPEEVEATALPMIQAVTAAYDDQRRKLQEIADVVVKTEVKQPELKPTAGLGTDEFLKQIEELKNVAPATYRQLIELNTQFRTSQSQAANEIERVNDQAAVKVVDYWVREEREKLAAIGRTETEIKNVASKTSTELISEARRTAEQTTLAERKSTDERLREIDKLAQLDQITFAQKITMSRAALDAEKANVTATTQAQIDQVNAVRTSTIEQIRLEEQKSAAVLGTAVAAEIAAKRIEQADEAANKKIEQLIQQLERMYAELGAKRKQIDDDATNHQIQNAQRAASIVSGAFGSALDKMTSQHMKFKQVLATFWADTVKGFEQMGIRIVQGWIQHLMQMVIETIIETKVMQAIMAAFGMTPPQQADTSAQAKKAVADTGQASADVFAQAIEAVPFPANLAAAPAAAAAVQAMMAPFVAEASGGGAKAGFEYGGVVPGREGTPVPAIVHAGETVFTNRATDVLRGAVPAISNFSSMIQNGGGITNNAADNRSTNYRTMHNHIRVEVHAGAKGGVDHDAIVAAVNKGIRRGQLKLG